MSVANTHIYTIFFYQLLDLSEAEKTKYLKELKITQVELYNKIYPLLCTSALEPLTHIFGVAPFKLPTKKLTSLIHALTKYHYLAIGRGGIGVVMLLLEWIRHSIKILPLKTHSTLLSTSSIRVSVSRSTSTCDVESPIYNQRWSMEDTERVSVYIVMEHIKKVARWTVPCDLHPENTQKAQSIFKDSTLNFISHTQTFKCCIPTWSQKIY